MNKTTVSWFVSVECILEVVDTENGPEIVRATARTADGKDVDLNLGFIDVRSEEKAMAEECFFDAE
jgi:hypothetical protein